MTKPVKPVIYEKQEVVCPSCVSLIISYLFINVFTPYAPPIYYFYIEEYIKIVEHFSININNIHHC